MVDISLVLADDFDPESFVRNTLRPGEQETFLRAIQEAKERASTDLQRNVFKNYHEFVALSKEITKLEDDMLVLRNLVQDLKSVAADPAEEDSLPDDADRGIHKGLDELETVEEAMQSQASKRSRRNVYEQVENLSRHLAPNPARKCLKEGTVTLESGLGNSKSFSLLLFTDALVVATRKWATVGNHKMVLEHCWGLTDVAIIDIKDSPDTVNSIKVIKHPDVYVYRFPSAEEKRSWFVAVKKATDDYLITRRAERDGAAGSLSVHIDQPSRRLAETASDGAGTAVAGPALAATPPRDTGDPSLSAAQWQWLGNLPDELDVWIAHRQYEPATVEARRALDLFKTLPMTRSPVSDVRTKIQNRIDELVSRIYRDLANPGSTKMIARRSIELLCNMNQAERARDAFLHARMAMIQHRIRQLNFDGDIGAYISQLSIVFFTLLRNTCEWYNEAFSDPAMTSGFLKWVKQQIEQFAAIFKSQVFESNHPFGVIAECLQAAVEHARNLRAVGLDLTFLLEHLFVPSSKEAVVDYTERQRDKIFAEIESDPFVGTKEGEDTLPSACFLSFQATVTRFLSDVMLLGTLALYDTIIKSFTTLMTSFAEGIGKRLSSRKLSDAQIMRAIADGINAVDLLIPAAHEQLSLLFDRPIVELEDLRTELLAKMREMIADYCDFRAQRLLSDGFFPFGNVDYSSAASIPDNAKPSVPITRLVVSLHEVAAAIVSPIDRHDVISRCIENVMVSMTQQGWDTPRGPRPFGFGGVQQLVLDIHFVLRICENYITDKTNDAANEVCERALRSYFAQRKDGPSATLKSGEWYDTRIDEVLAVAASQFSAF